MPDCQLKSLIRRRHFYIAEYEGRSGSGQILYLIRKCIAEFESEHSKIEIKEKDG